MRRAAVFERWLRQLGYALPALRQAGLVNANGYDTYTHRIVFPLEGNLYGRSIGTAAPHRFLPGSKGGLYAWEQVRRCPEIILVEGLFDYAVLWQAGFHNVTCSLGNHLNARQFQQLCDGPRTVYLAFDSDANGSGQLRGAIDIAPPWRSGRACPNASYCQTGTIPTASLSMAAMRNSFSGSWRPLAHDISGNPSAERRRGAKPLSRGRDKDWP